MSELFEKAERYLAVSGWKKRKLFTKAKGAKIWLNDKPLLDFACGPGVANIGYNHPEILETLREVFEKDAAGWGGNMFFNEYQIRLAEALAESTPGKFGKKVFFSNSGGEAVEAAILACLRRNPDRHAMLTFTGDFHGRLGFGRGATSSKALHVEQVPWAMPKIFFLPFPSKYPETKVKGWLAEAIGKTDAYMCLVETTIGPFLKEIGFALFELVQGEGGINIARKEIIQELFLYLRKNNIPIIVDEVQTGLGRTGCMWASELYEVEPDIITVAKALSGGVIPIGATIMRDELSYKKEGEHSNTFGGIPQACAVGLKTLEIIEKEKLVENAARKGDALRKLISNAGLAYDFSGVGMMNRLNLSNPERRDLIAERAFEAGLYLMPAGEQSVRLMPALTISDEELGEATRILAKIAL